MPIILHVSSYVSALTKSSDQSEKLLLQTYHFLGSWYDHLTPSELLLVDRWLDTDDYSLVLPMFAELFSKKRHNRFRIVSAECEK